MLDFQIHSIGIFATMNMCQKFVKHTQWQQQRAIICPFI